LKLFENLVDFFGTLLFLFPVWLYITYASFDYVLASWRYVETSVEAGGLAFVYIQKSLLLALTMSLMLQCIVELFRLSRLLFLSPAIGAKLAIISKEVIAEQSKQDPLMKKVYDAYIDYEAGVRKYHLISEDAYSRLRQ